ncbi:hypothetical protein EGR_08256 [Echinococcus granulosus]|uniref:Uncharacterized protein n=1 Tax=Echinococcus granulosus TaxID=6210 RepID=W6UU39_ECHGR|nr:hypothetical protein EGR_08256 [Echinococcus granulosus]EUB56904.1 hypothetical protein EGR_08256 [Echinococcus granulosus]
MNVFYEVQAPQHAAVEEDDGRSETAASVKGSESFASSLDFNLSERVD